MARISLFYRILIACSICFVTATPSTATPISFHEEFLGSSTDSDRFILYESYSAAFSFDIGQSNGSAQLFDHNGELIDTRQPSPDETGFKSGYNILDASLTFIFSSFDWLHETVKITASTTSGDEALFYDTFFLTACPLGPPDQKTVTLDLSDSDIFKQLEENGELITIALAVDYDFPLDWECFDNDFAIDSVMLRGTYEPVPEPASMLLFGVGLTFVGTVMRKTKHKTNHQRSA